MVTDMTLSYRPLVNVGKGQPPGNTDERHRRVGVQPEFKATQALVAVPRRGSTVAAIAEVAQSAAL